MPKPPVLRPTVMRLEAALDGESPSLLCPLIARCPVGRDDCRIFAPGSYCEDRDLVVLPEWLLDADDMLPRVAWEAVFSYARDRRAPQEPGGECDRVPLHS